MMRVSSEILEFLREIVDFFGRDRARLANRRSRKAAHTARAALIGRRSLHQAKDEDSSRFSSFPLPFSPSWESI